MPRNPAGSASPPLLCNREQPRTAMPGRELGPECLQVLQQHGERLCVGHRAVARAISPMIGATRAKRRSRRIPAPTASSTARRSWTGLRTACSSAMATARSPSRRAAARSRATASPRRAARARSRRPPPRSCASTARAYSTSAGGCAGRRCPAGAGDRCATRRAARGWSRAAWVRHVARAMRWSPPSCPVEPTRLTHRREACRRQQLADAPHRRVARMCGSRESTLCVRTSPRGSMATMSVKVRRGRWRAPAAARQRSAHAVNVARRRCDENCCAFPRARGAMMRRDQQGELMTSATWCSRTARTASRGQQDAPCRKIAARKDSTSSRWTTRHRRPPRARHPPARVLQDLRGQLVLVGSSMGGWCPSRLFAAAGPRMFLLAPALYMPGYEKFSPRPANCPTTIVHGWPTKSSRGQQHPLRARAEATAARRRLRSPQCSDQIRA